MIRRLSSWLYLCVLALVLPLMLAQAAVSAPPQVVVLTIDGPISPASADYVVRGIREAAETQADAVVLQMDTPGGLVTSMRDITKAILGSSVPVIGYVAPHGARAASAGTYILYASHVAAMAPATNVGAATPVSIGGGGIPLPRPSGDEQGPEEKDSPRTPLPQPGEAEMRKATNDAVASIRAMAERRGRNADWAEQAVREAVSVSNEEALELGVIDLIASDIPALLLEVDGFEVELASSKHLLHTADADLLYFEPGWHSRFLGVIANPSIAYFLLLLGLGGLAMEGMHPGAIVPGVVGAISLLLALYGLQMLPVNYAGLGLILLGIVLIVGEVFVPAYGILGIGGTVSLVTGSVFLMDTSVPGFEVALPMVVGTALAAAIILVAVAWLAIRSRKRPVVSGSEEMIGMQGVVVADFTGRGRVHVHGERWQAESGQPLQAGQRITVTARNGLILQVRPDPLDEEFSHD